MKFEERLKVLKEELEPVLQSRMIFLLNPKDTKTLEAIVAWSAMKSDFPDVDVPDNATMEDLWALFDVDMTVYATVLGCKLQEAVPRFSQLKGLNLIYPFGEVCELAKSIVGAYIKQQVDKIRPK